ncbi:MAG: hypothetical protein F6J87_11400 [Spirulina sp. SIO3F2]|nr:hypothetical protein [Spirulina sp. SIO3F2]
MRYFCQAVSVQLQAAVLIKARQFADQVTPTVGTPGRGYLDSHQPNLAKIHQDHFVSKVGEEAVKTVFERLSQQVKGPDYKIYSRNQKSWLADLQVEGVDLAVKTQRIESAYRFGLSWVFQAGSERCDPILSQPEAWVCFVMFDQTQSCCTVYPPYQIKELQFDAPRLAHLRNSKRVVYAERLPIVGLPINPTS